MFRSPSLDALQNHSCYKAMRRTRVQSATSQITVHGVRIVELYRMLLQQLSHNVTTINLCCDWDPIYASAALDDRLG